MQLTSSFLCLAAIFFGGAAAVPESSMMMGDPGVARYEPTYDNAGLSTLSVACSDGKNGLYTKGYTTLGAVPRFPLVGASATIAGWNSTECGSCIKLYYRGTQKSIWVTAVDVASPFDSGAFVLSKQALDLLTGGKAAQLGKVDVSWVKDTPQACGFPAPPLTTTRAPPTTTSVTTRVPTSTSATTTRTVTLT